MITRRWPKLCAEAEGSIALVFDRQILDVLPSRTDRRVEFIRVSLVELDAALRQGGGGLIVRQGDAREEIPCRRKSSVLTPCSAIAITSRRPRRVTPMWQAPEALGIGFESFKDQAIFDGAEVRAWPASPTRCLRPTRKPGSNAWAKTTGVPWNARKAGDNCARQGDS